MEWKAFASIIHTLRAHDLDSLLWSRGECHGSHAVRMIMDLSINSHHDRRPTLLSLLQDTRSFKSTLPVDKIYGLLNLISDAEECDISVDYTSDAASLYTDLAINHMMRTNTLDILHDCWGGGTESSTLVLPSWIPDWTVPHWHETAISWKLTFAAAGKSEPEFSFDDSRRTMFVKGRVLDSVAGVETVRQIPRNVEPNDFQGDPDIPPWLTQPGSKPWYYRDKDGKPYWESSHEKFFEESTKSRRAWIQNAMAVAFPNKTCTPAQFQALWRTFIWDLTPSGLRPSEEYGKLFSDWLVFVTATHEEFQQHRLARKAAGVNLDLREEDTVEESERDAVASKLEFGRANARCYNRRFYRSTAGRFGWGVDGIKPGDRICVFNGAQIPFIVRPVDGAHYRIIGDTYTHGLMYGEGTTSDYAEETIQLV